MTDKFAISFTPDDLIKPLSSLNVKAEKYKTAFVCDAAMMRHFCKWNSHHPETPLRLESSLRRCRFYELTSRCLNINSRRASEEELMYLHDKKYIKSVERTRDMKDEETLETFSSNFDSVYFNNKSFDCALLAAGCTLDLVSSVASGTVENGFAIVRPPGHHAMPNEACGFCIFNNVALAAKKALENHNVDRILIVDWDVHHGNGTQQMFYDDNRVLYFSIHRYEYGEFWPNLLESNFNFIGRGAGKGFNVNVPLNKTGLGNSEYLAIFHNILLPIAFEFNPQLILISAGYDAAIGCMEGQMNVSPYLYAHLISELSVLAEGRICAILEGGYFIPSLVEGVAMTLRSLLGDPCPTIGRCDVINRDLVNSILNVITVLCPFWKSINLQKVYHDNEDKEGIHIMSLRSVGNETFPGAPYVTREDNVRMSRLEYKKNELIMDNFKSNANLAVPKYRTYLLMVEMKHFQIHKSFKNEIPTLNIFDELKSNDLLEKCLLDASNVTKLASTDYVFYKVTLLNICDALNIPFFDSDDDINSSINLLEAVNNVVRGECVNSFITIKFSNQNTNSLSILDFLMIAAKHALTEYQCAEKNIKKVLIFNWDNHLENSIQPIRYLNKNVVIISLCHYHNNLPYDNIHACLKTRGSTSAYNINIPWKNNATSGDYFAAMSHIILPIAYEFCPDLILVAGFDVAYDSLHYCSELSSCYQYFLKLLGGLANGKMILVMKNEHNCKFISELAFSYIKALLGEASLPLPKNLYPSSEAIKVIQRVSKVYEIYWKCLQFGKKLPILDESCLR